LKLRLTLYCLRRANDPNETIDNSTPRWVHWCSS